MRIRYLLAMLLIAAPAPALAQVTARYKAGPREVLIEAAANGDYRVDVGRTSLLRIEGTEYLATPDKDGKPRVVKFADLIAVVDAEMRKMQEKMDAAKRAAETPEGSEGESPLAEDEEESGGEAAVSPDAASGEEMEIAPDAEIEAAADAAADAADAAEEAAGTGEPEEAPPPVPIPAFNFTLTRGAEATLAGYTGTSWVFDADMGNERTAEQKARSAKTFVMSKDPRLAPLGAPFKLAIGAVVRFGARMFGERSNFTARFDELMAQGVPIGLEKDLVLTSVDTAPIDPARFELPGPVIQAADFMAMMGPTSTRAVMVPLP